MLTPTYGLARGPRSYSYGTIAGQVTDDLTYDPIENATVAVWTSGGELVSSTETDSNGYYTIEIERSFESRSFLLVYAYYDDQGTLGFDYVPAFRTLRPTDENVTFSFVPAASIIFNGDISYVESPSPPSVITFTLIDPNSGLPLSNHDQIYVFENTINSHTYFLGLNPSHVIIPANTDVNIAVSSKVFVFFQFTIDMVDPLNLSQGQMVHVELTKYSMQFNLDLVKGLLREAEKTLNETEQQGFYVIAEKYDLETISGLIEKAEEELTQELYDACYSNIREAYIGVRGLNNKLEIIPAEASISAIILVFFLAFTSVALAYIFFERLPHKMLVTCIIYVVLLLVLHRTYPGYLIVDNALFYKTVIASLGVVFGFTFILPYFFKEQAVEGRIAFRSALVAVFSMAKRNLRRRRLRFILTLITVTVMVMSFVTLTSFSTGYGLIARPLITPTPPSEGLLIRNYISPTLSTITPFIPLNPSAVDWIQEKSETTLVAPKAENFAFLNPFGELKLANEPTQIIHLFGMLGILPSAEDSITNFNSIIIEGRSLRDNETAVLISASAAETLNATIGDRFFGNVSFGYLSYGFEVELVGIFDDNLFNQLRDLDGGSITPRKKTVLDETSEDLVETIVPCEPSEFIIINWQTALNCPGVELSRIDVQLNSTQDSLSFARSVALEYNYWVWSAISGKVYLTSLNAYLEAKGLPIFIPWVIVMLNIVTTMLNAIYERRREITILSSVGLNPSHITALFSAESLIIGIIGGGIGYISGLSLYSLMSTLSITLQVRQKVSIVWCLAALGMAATTVLIGGIVALRSSVIITPSLQRRWKDEEKPSTTEGQWVFNMPTKIRQSEINAFLDYIKRRFKKYESNVDVLRIGRLKQIDEETPQDITKRIKFNYYYGGGTFGGFFTVNEFVATKKKGEEIYTIKMFSKGSEDWSYKTANFIRTLILEWSAVKK